MVTETENYPFQIPDEGGDDDNWGEYLNNNWAEADALFKSLQDQIDNLRIKVGDLYFSTDATDPATKLGYGTWQAYGAGRAIVGVGSNGQTTWTNGVLRGSETHTLTIAQLPNHSHWADPPTASGSTGGAGGHYHFTVHNGSVFNNPLDSSSERIVRTHQSAASTFNVELGGTGAEANVGRSTTVNDHAHSFSINIPGFNTSGAGSGDAHNNIQPSIGTYVWKRTA